MKTIQIDERLWAGSMCPEGILERWFVEAGAWVQMGQKVAEVSMEGARHEIVAPAAGVIVRMMQAGELIEPGDSIGQVR